MRRKVYAYLSVLSLVALLLCACAVPVAPPAAEEIVAVEAEETVPVAPTPEPAETGGGTLTIAVDGDIDNFDPHWNQLIAFEVLIGHNVFNYLTRLGPDMTVQPDLATDWDISEDGTTYTFRLRPDAKFHNGRPVVADDVVYSFNRTIDQKMTFATKLDPIASIEAVDDHTVRIVTKSPWAPFLEDVGVIAIIPEEAAENLSKEPIGSGPFKFVEWVPNDRITLEKNTDYDIPGVPMLDQIVIKVLPDMTVALTNLEAGDVNAVYDVPAADASRFRGRSDILFQAPPASNSLFLFEIAPNRYEPLQDARVRRALAMCLDKEAIQQNVYFGEGDIQWSSLPKSSWAYVEPEGPSYDPEAAMALLADAGYPDGFELNIEVISGHAVMENIATIWQEGLAQAGVTLNVNISDLSTWLDRYVNRNYQVIANTMNVRGDPHSMYDIIWKPHLTDENSFPNEEMLGLIEEGASTLDLEGRKEIYAQLQRLSVEEMAPAIIIQSQPLIALTSTDVQGWTMNGKNDIFFDKIHVEP